MAEKTTKIQPKEEKKLVSKQIAVVMLGGRQFIVSDGMQIKVEKIDQEPGKVFQTKDLLDGKDVSYTVVENVKDKKISHIKFKNKTRYIKRLGHRQTLTVVKIESIK